MCKPSLQKKAYTLNKIKTVFNGIVKGKAEKNDHSHSFVD